MFSITFASNETGQKQIGEKDEESRTKIKYFWMPLMDSGLLHHCPISTLVFLFSAAKNKYYKNKNWFIHSS